MLAKSIPIAAQELLDAIADCKEQTTWTEDAEGKPLTYLHPQGKVVYQGLISPGSMKPDGGYWEGTEPMFLIVYHHPLNAPGCCDAHWFAVDLIEVKAVEIKD